MGRLPGGGVYGARDVAAALGVEPRDLAAMIRAGKVPSAAWVEALQAEKKPKLDMTAFIRSLQIT
jgi:hypothetical protein